MQEFEELNDLLGNPNLAFDVDLALEEIICLLAAEEIDIAHKQIALWWLVAHRPNIAEKSWSWLQRRINERY